MLAAIILFEVEFANRQIKTLLDERTRSEQDLQFIVDNSLDVILITDNVGLLQSWSNKAQSIFGYVPDQAVGKIHMDDLFANNYWGRDIGAAECFSSEMENVDGRRFPVEVRMREVNDAGSKYHVFVVNVLEPKLGD
jgi:PAS domain S-box-containing protein